MKAPVLALLLGGLLGAGIADRGSAHVDVQPLRRREVSIPIRNFILTDQDQKPFEFQSVHGKVVVVAFAYTTCPDVCPLITAALRKLQSSLGPLERGAVQLITITTDPEVDSPEVLRAYAKRYGASLSNWAFLTGSEARLAPVWKAFGVRVERRGRGLVDHTPLTAIVDRRGTMRVAYIGPAPDQSILLRDVRRLLAPGGS